MLMFTYPIVELISSAKSKYLYPSTQVVEITVSDERSTDTPLAEDAVVSSSEDVLVFGIEAPDKEAAALAANYRGPLVRDVASSIPTRLVGNSNSSYGTIIRMAYNNDNDTILSSPADAPVFMFNSSTFYEDARQKSECESIDDVRRIPV
jgi:hypothetical protein